MKVDLKIVQTLYNIDFNESSTCVITINSVSVKRTENRGLIPIHHYTDITDVADVDVITAALEEHFSLTIGEYIVNYWKECIEESFEDAGITATKEQIYIVASWVEGAYDNYGMAHGRDCIPNQLEEDIRALKASHAKEIKELEKREQCYKQSVAMRRGTKPENVWLENGEVHYD